MKLARKHKLFVALAAVVLIFGSCSRDEGETLSSKNDLIGFSIENIGTRIEGGTVYLDVPSSLGSYQLIPVVTLSDRATAEFVFNSSARMSLDKDHAYDFEEISAIAVIAENRSEKIYPMVINKLPGLKSVTLKFGSYDFYKGSVDEIAKTVTFDLYLPLSTSSQGILGVEFAGNRYSTSIPHSDEVVASSNGELLCEELMLFDNELNLCDKYKLILRNKAAELKDIQLPVESFGVNPVIVGWAYPKYCDGLTNNYDLVYFVLEGQDVSNLKPLSLTVSKNATVSPGVDAKMNFNNIVEYEVTSQTGIKMITKVKVVTRKIIVSNDHDKGVGGFIFRANESSIFFTYKAISPVEKAWLVNTQSLTEYDATVLSSTTSSPGGGNYLYLANPAGLPLGKYQLKVELKNGDRVLTDAQCSKE